MSLVRPGRLVDAEAIARIEVETWRSTYAGMLPDRVLLNMSERRQTASWASFLRHRPDDTRVACNAKGAIVGFGNCGAQRDSNVDYGGEVYTLYVTPDAQGQGTGRQILLALFARLVATGYSSALVWVVRANPARYFYERIGSKQVMYRPIPVAGQPVDAVAYGWRDLAAVLGRYARSGDGLAGDPRR
ncbi:MAG TPA: N-acetyltransferase [Stellaceae bacterium]|nr:N-acetyltransferase [Stellaceae bacterium]